MAENEKVDFYGDVVSGKMQEDTSIPVEERTRMKEQLVEDIVECVRVDLMEGYLMDLYNANSDEDREFVGDFDSVFNGFLESETYKQLKDVNTLMFLRGSDYIFGQYLREIGKEHLIPTYVKQGE